jgi:ABC-2 type transport system ATP-binding protein
MRRPEAPARFHLPDARSYFMTEETLADVRAVSRHYGPIIAVRDVSFSVCRGQVLGFLGPNGAGKTTTMQMLTGNLAPSAGEITIAGHDLLDDPIEARRAIGYLPETPPVYRELTVDEYLDYCAALNRIPRKDRRAARDRAKHRCGLADAGRRLIGNLSKGYQQRVGLAQAIIHLPPLIVLDEPTVGLDPIQIREIRSLIRELGRDHAVILSTHILPEVQAVCDRVQIIHKGSLVLNDSIEGLSQRMRSSSLAVAFRHDPGVDALRSVAGIADVRADADGRYLLFHEPDSDPTDTIVRRAVEANGGLFELMPHRASLEDIFVHLTTEEPAAQEAA